MPLMFLEHINFRPVDGGRLVQSVECDTSNMRVRANVPEFMDVVPGYQEFIKELQQHPEKHLTFTHDQVYDPEAVLYLNYLEDHKGWARTMQIHPDGSVDIVRHRPNQLNRGVRWILPNRRPASLSASNQVPLKWKVMLPKREKVTCATWQGAIRLYPIWKLACSSGIGKT